MNVLNLCFSVLRLDDSVFALHVTPFQHVQLVFICVQVTEAEPESYTTKESKDSDDGIVPDKKRILRKRSERLSDSRGEGTHEEVDRHDHGLHIGGCLGVCVFQGGYWDKVSMLDRKFAKIKRYSLSSLASRVRDYPYRL